MGKTTILLQIVRQLLKSTTAQAICYLRLDDPDLAGQPLGRLVDLYRKSCRSPNRLAYLLLDEVHGSPGWAQQMKSWVDGNEPNRVLATGSLAPHLTDGSRESGPGRWDEVVVPPLGLFEYALLQGLAKEEEARLLPDGWWERPQVPVPQLERDLWPGYLLKGGFPASALENDVTTAHQRLREDIYERALVRDMAVYFGLRSFDTLRHLFRYVAEQSSCIANTKVLSARSGASAATIADMLVRLRETFLVAQTLPFVRGKAALRPRPKLYLCDASLRSAVLLHGPEIFQDASALGYIYETAAHSHLAHLARSRGGELSYWRDERGEVDFLMALPGRS
ncbi:MAG: ATP-binding protein, partial [Armatimonadetes bacterium]|nr:ATP-binding protein [Armatimonadota bacterium]